MFCANFNIIALQCFVSNDFEITVIVTLILRTYVSSIEGGLGQKTVFVAVFARKKTEDYYFFIKCNITNGYHS